MMMPEKNLMEKTNILITSAGRRVSLVNFFIMEVKKANLNSKVYCTDMKPEISSACQVADDFFKVSRVTDKKYIDELLSLCIKNKIGLIIPTIDFELEVLAENRDLLLKNGITPLVCDIEFIKKCRDKHLIHKFFDEINFRRAKEFDIDNIIYPTFVKPKDGSRSLGTHVLNSKEELSHKIISNDKNMYLEYINPKEFTEFTVDIYFNKKSEILSIVPRERILVRDGEVNKACTRNNMIIKYIKERLPNVKGLVGCIAFQVFKHNSDETIIAIEINPRFGGGYPLSYHAGANFPKWIIQEYLLNQSLTEYREDWKSDLLMLRYDEEILVDDYKY